MSAPRNILALSQAAILLAALSFCLLRSAAPQISYGSNRTVPSAQSLPNSRGDVARYLDFPPARLKQAVPQLKGLDYEAGQDSLPAILAGMAKSIDATLRKLPDLTSREDIYHFQSARDANAAGGQVNAQPWNREFKYLLLCHHNSDGSTSLEESRTDGKGRPADLSGPLMSPRGFGFAYQWLLFSAANQPEFRFRYLGQQNKEGKKTFVVAFAQIPDQVSGPANFQSESTAVPFFYQGVLWIDQSTMEIVLLRTDLLDPIPRLNLRQLTTEVHFSTVAIRDLDSRFWLPKEVDISTDQGQGIAEEDHRYSDYHLFHSTAKIIPAP